MEILGEKHKNTIHLISPLTNIFSLIFASLLFVVVVDVSVAHVYTRIVQIEVGLRLFTGKPLVPFVSDQIPSFQRISAGRPKLRRFHRSHTFWGQRAH